MGKLTILSTFKLSVKVRMLVSKNFFFAKFEVFLSYLGHLKIGKYDHTSLIEKLQE